MNAASGGTVEIELYPNGALGRAPQQQAQMVLDGVADIGFIVPPFTPGRFPDSEVMELPGLFRDLAEATQVYTRLLQAGVLHDWFQPVSHLRIVLPQSGVGGLSVGADVEVLGIHAGTVRRIVLNPDQQMYAECDVDQQAHAFIRQCDQHR